jgi:integrase
MDLTVRHIHSVKAMIGQFLAGYTKRNTQRNYAKAIHHWAGFLLELEPGSQEVTWQHLLMADIHQAKGFLLHLRQKGISDSTQALYLSGLAKFYDELIGSGINPEHGNIFRNELVKLPRGARKPKNPSQAFTEQQVADILSQAKSERDLAILALLFGAGLRKDEIINLQIGDLRDRDGIPCLILRDTKSDVLKEQSVADWVAEAVREHSKGRDSGRLFEISRTGIDDIFARCVARAGIAGKWSPHDARTTAINVLFNEGASPQEIQNFSRHKSLQMLEIYRRRRDSIANNPGRGLAYGDFGRKKED